MGQYNSGPWYRSQGFNIRRSRAIVKFWHTLDRLRLRLSWIPLGVHPCTCSPQRRINGVCYANLKEKCAREHGFNNSVRVVDSVCLPLPYLPDILMLERWRINLTRQTLVLLPHISHHLGLTLIVYLETWTSGQWDRWATGCISCVLCHIRLIMCLCRSSTIRSLTMAELAYVRK